MARVRINRADPEPQTRPFKLTRGDAEQVTPNGLSWNEGRIGRVYSEPTTNPYPEGEMRWQGNRADMVALGGNKMVNYPAGPGKIKPGNRSGE